MFGCYYNKSILSGRVLCRTETTKKDTQRRVQRIFSSGRGNNNKKKKIWQFELVVPRNCRYLEYTRRRAKDLDNTFPTPYCVGNPFLKVLIAYATPSVGKS